MPYKVCKDAYKLVVGEYIQDIVLLLIFGNLLIRCKGYSIHAISGNGRNANHQKGDTDRMIRSYTKEIILTHQIGNNFLVDSI